MKTQITFLQALRKARQLIKNKDHTYICNALNVVGGGKYANRVNSQLKGCNTYSEWLSVHHPIIYQVMSVQDFRQGRLQWIDYMIAQEKAK